MVIKEISKRYFVIRSETIMWKGKRKRWKQWQYNLLLRW